MKTFKVVSNKKNIFGQIAYPQKLPAPAVILLHGFTNNMGDCPINKDLFKILPQKGFIAIQFDFIGSGKSDGEFKDKTLKRMYNNFLGVLKFFKEDTNISSVGVVGKSIAGLFPIMSAEKNIKATALLSTAISPKKQFYRIWKTKRGLVEFGIKATGEIKGKFALGQSFFTQLSDIEKKCKNNLPNVKNVIHFHGTADPSVPFEQGHFQYIKDHITKPSKSVKIAGVGHSYDNKQSLVVQDILSWFSKYL